MRRLVVVSLAVASITVFGDRVDAQPPDWPRVYLPYLRRDPTPTPRPTSTPAPVGPRDPLTCGSITDDPSLETAAGGEIVEDAEINLFPNDLEWNGVIDGEHWITATRGQVLPLIDAAGAARTGKWAMSFLGNGSMGTGMVFSKRAIGVRTNDSVESAAAVFWYKMFAGGEDGRDRMLIEAVGFDREDRGSVGLQVVTTLPFRRSEMREEWTRAVVDFTPYVRGFVHRGARWNIVGLRFVSADGDGAAAVTNWLIDDVQLHVCFRNAEARDVVRIP